MYWHWQKNGSYLGCRRVCKLFTMLNLLGKLKSRKKTTVCFYSPNHQNKQLYLVSGTACEACGVREPSLDRTYQRPGTLSIKYYKQSNMLTPITYTVLSLVDTTDVLCTSFMTRFLISDRLTGTKWKLRPRQLIVCMVIYSSCKKVWSNGIVVSVTDCGK